MRFALVPSAPGLLSEYAGLTDPLAEVRSSAVEAVRWLVEPRPANIVVLASDQVVANHGRGRRDSAGMRIARQLLREAGFDGAAGSAEEQAVLVVANGTATRSEKAPGHFDERAQGFDDELERALETCDVDALAALDADLGAQLWCSDVGAFVTLGALAEGIFATATGGVDLSADPYGVQYWVGRWICES